MAETATVARPYAEAVFGIAEEAGALARWQGMLAAMAQVASHPEMRAWIDNPGLGAKQLYDLFTSACAEDLPMELRNFVRVLIANDRLALLPEISAQFLELKNAHESRSDLRLDHAFMRVLQLQELRAD